MVTPGTDRPRRRRRQRGAHRLIWSPVLTRHKLCLMVDQIMGRLATEAEAARRPRQVRNITVIPRPTRPAPPLHERSPVAAAEVTAPLRRCGE